MPTDKDLLDDLLLDKDPEPEAKFDPKEMEDLKASLAELEKQNQGLLKGLKDERSKKQELKGRLDEVTSTVNHILTTKEEQAAQQLEKKVEAKVNGIPVEFTEEGDAFVPTDKLEHLTSPYEERIKELEAQIEQVSGAADLRAQAQATINGIVGENEAYGPAYNRYQSARKWVDDKVIDFQHSNNIQGTLSSGQALDHVFKDDLKQEFESTFENIDLASIVTAEDSIHHFRTMLSNVAEATTPKPDNKPDSRFQQVLQKPSGLGKSANAKAGETPLSERAGNLTAADIMDLSDDQIKALERSLLKEEQTDGVQF
jgi:hypothetical protein